MSVAEEILDKLRAGEPITELIDVDFSGQDLSGVSFAEATLSRVSFTGATLAEVSFEKAR